MAEEAAGKKLDAGLRRTEEQVVADLVRVCVGSAHCEVTTDDLDRDFCVLAGYNIPYQKFGFGNLKAYLETIPGINFRRDQNGAMLLRCKKDDCLNEIGKFKNADRNPKSQQSAQAPSNAVCRTYPPYNPNPNYLGTKFDPNHNSWTKMTQRGPQFQPRACAPERVRDKDVWEPQEEKLPTWETIPDVHNVVESMEDKVAKMTIEEVAKSVHEEHNFTCQAKPDEIFGPRMFIARGLANTRTPDDANSVDAMKSTKKNAGITAIASLQAYLLKHGLPPAKLRVESLPFTFCEISVNIFVFSKRLLNTQTVEDCLAEMALNALKIFQDMNLTREIDLNRPNDAVNRILMLVYSQPSGIWREFIPRAYFLKYEEEPPDNWAELFLHKADNVAIVRVSGEPDSFVREIWKPKLVSPGWQHPGLAAPFPNFTGQLPSRPLRRTRTFQPPREIVPVAVQPLSSAGKIVILGQVQVAPRKKYAVEVTSVEPDGSFWARVATTEYQAVYEEMAKHFASCSLPSAKHNEEVLFPTVGACYVAFIREAWHRVKLTCVLEDGTAIVFLIDGGDEEKILFKCCANIPEKFTDLPGLAVHCVLDGFEGFRYRREFVAYLRKTVQHRRFVADVREFQAQLASVYLTGTESSCSIVVNYDATDFLSKGISNYRDISLERVYKVRVTHVTENCSVYVQVCDDSELLQKLMSRQLEYKLLHHPPQRVTKVVVGDNVYFARLLDTHNSIFRVVALQPPEATKVLVSFIDSGDKGYVPLNCVYELMGFFNQLYYLGPQAIMVRLASIPVNFITKAMGQRLRELAPPESSVLMKVTTLATVPVVEVFKRLMPENILVSINNTVLLDPALQGPPAMISQKAFALAAATTEHTSAIALSKGPFLPVTPYTPDPEEIKLPLAAVPPVGTEFDIHVPLVSNPNNFIVQPWNTFFSLQTLMYELQIAYENSGAGDAPLASDIAPGKCYAGLHQDGSWYRITASSSVINEDTVLASFVDYGDLQVLQLTNLRRLAPRFCELPCQAIRASLYGVKPLHQDWCVEDCLAFQALVNDHQFVSIVMSKPSNSADPQEASVGLKLIDTSGSEDVHIDQLLVSEGRAEVSTNSI